MEKLTVAHIRNAKPREKPYKLPDGKGLYFHVSRSGKRTWRYRYKIAGKESTYVLGEYPMMSLGQARVARADARELIKDGINPAQDKRERKQRQLEKEQAAKEKEKNSFEAIAVEWVSLQRDSWTKEHGDSVLGTLRNDAFPSIGHLQ